MLRYTESTGWIITELSRRRIRRTMVFHPEHVRKRKRSVDAPPLIPTTSNSGCLLNVVFPIVASLNAQTSIVHPKVPAAGNCRSQTRKLYIVSYECSKGPTKNNAIG
jgi:hypothetical protein